MTRCSFMARSFFSWNKTFILLVITIYNYIFHWFVCKFILLNEFHVCWLFCKKSYLWNFTLWVNNSRFIANRVYNMSPSSIHPLKFQILDIYNINIGIVELYSGTSKFSRGSTCIHAAFIVLVCKLNDLFLFFQKQWSARDLTVLARAERGRGHRYKPPCSLCSCLD